MNKDKKILIILLLLLQSYNFTFAGTFYNDEEKEDEIRLELRENVKQNKQLNNKVIAFKKSI